MPQTPVPKELTDLDAGWIEDDAEAGDRPTVAPPFDLESYAKENAAGPVSRGATTAPTSGSETTRSLEDRVDEFLDSRGVIPRTPTDTALTLPPPAPRAPGSLESPRSEPLSRRETPQRVQQLEAARALSARDDLGTGTILSLANMRVPSNLPPRLVDDPVVTMVEAENEAENDAESGLDALAPSQDPEKEMQERFALGDYSGALVMAESLLEENPTHVEAREYAESCRAVLQQMYAAKIGPLDRVPVVEVAREQLRWLSIDHRAGFVLSLVDGVSSIEMILDVSGMPSLDALRILFELVQQRIISLRGG